MRPSRAAPAWERDLGIFLFGWIGGIVGVFFLSYANPFHEQSLAEFFWASVPAILHLQLLGGSLFLAIMVLRRIVIGVWFE